MMASSLLPTLEQRAGREEIVRMVSVLNGCATVPEVRDLIGESFSIQCACGSLVQESSKDGEINTGRSVSLPRWEKEHA